MIGGVKAALLPGRRWCVVHAALIESESMTLATERRGRNLADQLIGARIAECPLLLAQDDVGEHLTSFGPTGSTWTQSRATTLGWALVGRFAGFVTSYRSLELDPCANSAVEPITSPLTSRAVQDLGHNSLP
jgi:hypothetical protein